MTTAGRLFVLLALPLLFCSAGALSAVWATKAVKLIAPEPVTLIDAVAAGDEEATYRMVSAGKDPGLPVALERSVFHWRKGDVVSPLLVAVVESDPNQIAYLAQQTRRLSEPPNDEALCVAARYGNSNVARLLMKLRVPVVPENGCGEIRMPEDVAAKYGSGGLSKELRQYRTERGHLSATERQLD